MVYQVKVWFVWIMYGQNLCMFRYTPPEGHYPFDNLLESTYIVRPPWGHISSIVIPPHRTLEVPLTIPHRPSYTFSPAEDHNLGSSPFANVDELLSFNALDGFYNSDMDSTRVRLHHTIKPSVTKVESQKWYGVLLMLNWIDATCMKRG